MGGGVQVEAGVHFGVFLKRKRKNLFWNEQEHMTLCGSGNVGLIQLRQPFQQLLGF